MIKTVDMLKIHIHMYGILADYSGIKDLTIDIPNKTTISGLLNILKPKILNKDWMDSDKDQSTVKIFRNEELITPEMGNKIIEDGDDIRFFSAISGG